MLPPEKLPRFSIQRLRSKAARKRAHLLDNHGTRLTASRRPATNRGMENKALAVLVLVAFSSIAVLGDYVLKLAREEPQSLRSQWFYVRFAVYAFTAFG